MILRYGGVVVRGSMYTLKKHTHIVAWGQFECNSKAKGHFTHETESPSHYSSSTLIGGKGGASSSSLHTMLEGPMEYGIYMDSYMASNGSCFMVT